VKLRHLLLGAAGLPPAAVLVAWLGIFDVAASSGHWAVTEWFLHMAMRSSVRTWALGVEVPDTLPRDALRPAAGHYARGCAYCHGAPGRLSVQAVEGMLPTPPELAPQVAKWTDAQLFRIVKHGVRFTGMPAWPARSRDDEVWSMVAFLRALPQMTPAAYAALVAPPRPGGPLPEICAGCHGPQGRDGGPSVPILAGQREEYLGNSLVAFATGHRPSGMMALPAVSLAPEARVDLARRLAMLPPPSPAPADRALRAAGRELAEHGRPADAIPRCLACHGARAKPAFPRLDGQRPDYIASQLRLFRAGARGGGPYAGLMTRAARGLTDADITAAAAYFSSRRAQPQPADDSPG
jgi:cytochrome c553